MTRLRRGVAIAGGLTALAITGCVVGSVDSPPLDDCEPTSCAAQGKNCGTANDGCGATLTCGDTCPGSETCGGGGVANVCGGAPGAPDTAPYSFEAGVQSWATSGALIAGIGSSTAQAFEGTYALAVNFAGAAAGMQEVSVSLPAVPAGATVTFHVWIPTDSAIIGVQPFVLQGATGGWTWTGTYVATAALTLGAWNTLTVTTPAGAVTPLARIGVEFTTNGAWAGTAFIDTVSWTATGCMATTCVAEGKNCGTISDGCTGTLTCGSTCPASETCGGGGVANVCGAVAFVTPGDPGPSDVQVAVTSQDVVSVSPLIFGLNAAAQSGLDDWGAQVPTPELARLGGNRFTAWNWETGWSNAGTDYNRSNDQHLTTSATPGAAVSQTAGGFFAAGAGLIVTVPIIGWVSKSVAGNAAVANTTMTDTAVVGTPSPLGCTTGCTYFQRMAPQNPSGPGVGVPHGDGGTVYGDDFFHWLDITYPDQAVSPTAPLLLSLDNEPDLWSDTHDEIRGRTSSGDSIALGRAELVALNAAYAARAKAVIPDIAVLGFVAYGWGGLFSAQYNPWPPYANTTGGTQSYSWYVDDYLDNIRYAGEQAGVRLVDALDIHWYPEANDGATRVVFNEAATQSEALINAREQSPRSLWDPTYIEQSWITMVDGQATRGPGGYSTRAVQLLNRLDASIDTFYPGTRLCVTEWNYGRMGDISGAIAMADVLGIFARRGVYCAALWDLTGQGGDPYGGDRVRQHAGVAAVFKAFLDYDGARHGFGDTYAQTTTLDPNPPADPANAGQTLERIAAYGSYDSAAPGDRLVIVAINKSQSAALNVAFRVTHTATFARAHVYRITGTNGVSAAVVGPTPAADIVLPTTNAFVTSLPAQSITTFVLVP